MSSSLEEMHKVCGYHYFVIKGGEIDIGKPENCQVSRGLPPPPILGQTIDTCINGKGDALAG